MDGGELRTRSARSGTRCPPPRRRRARAGVAEPATRIVAHVAVTQSDQGKGSAPGDGSATPVTKSLLGQTDPGKPSRGVRWLRIVGGVGALAIAAALWFGRSHAAAPAAVATGGASGTSVVMLVAERGAVAVEPGTSAPLVALPHAPASAAANHHGNRAAGGARPSPRRRRRVCNAGGGQRPTRSPVSRRR